MPAATDTSDASKHRNDERLVRLVREHQNAMVSFARHVAPNHEWAIAEDIVQDALIAVLQGCAELPEADEEALAVVRRRIKNVGLNRRRRERLRRVESLDGSHPADSDESDPWKDALAIHVARDVRAAIEMLTEGEQEVTELHVLEQWTFKEIASYRGSLPQTAKELYRRARRKLYTTLKHRYGFGSRA